MSNAAVAVVHMTTVDVETCTEIVLHPTLAQLIVDPRLSGVVEQRKACWRASHPKRQSRARGQRESSGHTHRGDPRLQRGPLIETDLWGVQRSQGLITVPVASHKFKIEFNPERAFDAVAASIWVSSIMLADYITMLLTNKGGIASAVFGFPPSWPSCSIELGCGVSRYSTPALQTWSVGGRGYQPSLARTVHLDLIVKWCVTSRRRSRLSLTQAPLIR